MSDELKVEKEFEAYFEMFQTVGWKLLMRELKIQLESVDCLENTGGLDDLRIRQGKLAILKQMLNKEATNETEYNQWKIVSKFN